MVAPQNSASVKSPLPHVFCGHQKSLARPLFTFGSNRRFNPLGVSSATVLKQLDEELEMEELALKRCLESYQLSTQSSSEEDPVLLEELQQAYSDLGYWSDALGVEKLKCELWFQPDTDEYADSIHAQGKFYLRQDDFGNSKPLYEQALEYFQRNNNTVQQGHVLISLAGWYYFRDQLDEALRHLQQAEKLLDTNPALLVKCLDNQGLIYRLFGDFEIAMDKYQQALQVVVSEDTRHALQMHVADMLVALEEPGQAMSLYQELLSETGNNPGIQGVLWHNIASIHVEMGDYQLALEEFQRALHLKQQTGGEHHPEVAKTWNSLGALHLGVLEDLVPALECFRHVLWIARAHAVDPQSDPEVLAALQNISTIEQLLDK